MKLYEMTADFAELFDNYDAIVNIEFTPDGKGGFVDDDSDLGFATVKALGHYFGIPEVDCISANAMDIPTTDVETVLEEIIGRLPGII